MPLGYQIDASIDIILDQTAYLTHVIAKANWNTSHNVPNLTQRDKFLVNKRLKTNSSVLFTTSLSYHYSVEQ